MSRKIIWQDSPEVQEIAEDLIEVHHPHLEGCQIRYIFRSRHINEGRTAVYARVILMSGLNGFLTNADIVMEVGEDVWHSLDDHQKRALIDHELCHCIEGDQGGWALRPHDVEEFTEIMLRYGAWLPSREQFVKAANDYEQGRNVPES